MSRRPSAVLNVTLIELFGTVAAAIAIPAFHASWRPILGETAWSLLVFPLAIAAGVGGVAAVETWPRLQRLAPVGPIAVAWHLALALALVAFVPVYSAWPEIVAGTTVAWWATVAAAISLGWAFSTLMSLAWRSIQHRADATSDLRMGLVLAGIGLGCTVGWYLLPQLGIRATVLVAAAGIMAVAVAAIPHGLAASRESVTPPTQPQPGHVGYRRHLLVFATALMLGAVCQIWHRCLYLWTSQRFTSAGHVLLPVLFSAASIVLAMSFWPRFARWSAYLFVGSLLVLVVALPLLLMKTPAQLAGLLNQPPETRLVIWWCLVAMVPGVSTGLLLVAANRVDASGAEWQGTAWGMSAGWAFAGLALIPSVGLQITLSFTCALTFLLVFAIGGTWLPPIQRSLRAACILLATVAFGCAGWFSGLFAGERVLPHRWLLDPRLPGRVSEEAGGTLVSTVSRAGEADVLFSWNGRLVSHQVPNRAQSLAMHFAAVRRGSVDQVLLIQSLNGVNAALVHDAQRVLAVERSQAMMADFFERAPVSQPTRVEALVGDGRASLLDSNERFDVIVVGADAIPAPDSAGLFTTEFYETVRLRLSDSGVFCQEVAFWNYTSDEFVTIVSVFTASFPKCSLWYAGRRLVLMGAETAPSWTRERVAERLAQPAVASQLDFSLWAGSEGRLNHMENLVGALLCEDEGLRKIASSNGSHGDHLPWLARIRSEDPYNAVEIYQTLQAVVVGAGADAWWMAAERTRIANLRQIVAESEASLAAADMSQGNLARARERLDQACNFSPKFIEAHVARGDVLLMLGGVDDATRAYRRAVEIDPLWFTAQARLGNALLRQGDLPGAARHFEAALQLNPGDGQSLLGLAWLKSTAPDEPLRDAPRALALLQALQVSPLTRQPEVLDVWAAALANAGDYSRAVEVASTAQQLAQLAGNGQLAADIQNRLTLYRQNRPFRLPKAAPGN